MTRLTIEYEAFKENPRILLEEIKKTGMEGCIYYQGREYVVTLNLKEAVNDPVYEFEKGTPA